MKTNQLLLAVATLLLLLTGCNKEVKNTKMLSELTDSDVQISRIDPTDWYAGMKNPTLQLMVYGQGIREAEVSVSGAKVDSLVRLDSPNYLLVYLNTSGTKAGTLPLTFKLGDKETTIGYQLKDREMAGSERRGFDISDVLYLLMPDRFAQGSLTPAPSQKEKGSVKCEYVVDRTKPSLRHGGDIAGIRQHLDYFTDLGVTALWFTPILENDSPDMMETWSTYHGYACTDYYRVDPRFGTN